MPLLKDDYVKTEKINGIIYNMSPSGSYVHGCINGNIYHSLRRQLKNSLCSVSIENYDLYLSDDEYAELGVDEYWILSPNGHSLEVYYLEDGAYKLVASYILEDDEADEYYNADTVLTLKSMPNISIQLQEIFENVE